MIEKSRRIATIIAPRLWHCANQKEKNLHHRQSDTNIKEFEYVKESLTTKEITEQQDGKLG